MKAHLKQTARVPAGALRAKEAAALKQALETNDDRVLEEEEMEEGEILDDDSADDMDDDQLDDATTLGSTAVEAWDPFDQFTAIDLTTRREGDDLIDLTDSPGAGSKEEDPPLGPQGCLNRAWMEALKGPQGGGVEAVEGFLWQVLDHIAAERKATGGTTGTPSFGREPPWLPPHQRMWCECLEVGLYVGAQAPAPPATNQQPPHGNQPRGSSQAAAAARHAANHTATLGVSTNHAATPESSEVRFFVFSKLKDFLKKLSL
jgi:hypothetical protein